MGGEYTKQPHPLSYKNLPWAKHTKEKYGLPLTVSADTTQFLDSQNLI